jgi:hypothetical protein
MWRRFASGASYLPVKEQASCRCASKEEPLYDRATVARRSGFVPVSSMMRKGEAGFPKKIMLEQNPAPRITVRALP